MNPMRRRVFAIVSGVSLGLAIVLAVAWMWSCWSSCEQEWDHVDHEAELVLQTRLYLTRGRIWWRQTRDELRLPIPTTEGSFYSSSTPPLKLRWPFDRRIAGVGWHFKSSGKEWDRVIVLPLWVLVLLSLILPARWAMLNRQVCINAIYRQIGMEPAAGVQIARL